jgi:hypothetical protein
MRIEETAHAKIASLEARLIAGQTRACAEIFDRLGCLEIIPDQPGQNYNIISENVSL